MIRVVHGEEIRHWYNEKNHSNLVTDGGLHCSSMKFEHMQPYFDLYTKNANVGLLISTCVDQDFTERLAGRALIWTTETGEVCVDRLYAEEFVLTQMIQYILNHGWTWLQFVTRKLNVRLDKVQFDHYPYVDTFRYLAHDGTWYLTNRVDENVSYELGSHQGSIYKYERDW